MFFELGATGHRIDYVHYLLEGLAAQPVQGSVTFVLGPDFRSRLNEGVVRRAKNTNDLDILYMKPAEVSRCHVRWALVRSHNILKTVDRYLISTQSELAHLNYLDNLMPALALRFPSAAAGLLCGILFRPTAHYRALGRSGGEPPWQAVSQEVKRHMLSLALSNRRLWKVLSLDPLFPEYARQHYQYGNKVISLPEPYAIEDSRGRAAGSEGPPERVTFLLFGTISERKGVLELLQAVERLEPNEARRLRIVLAGPISQPLRRSVGERLTAITRRFPEVEIEIEDRFVPLEELRQFIATCDVVLAAYNRHVGSSGVLTWAAQYRKPVISQAYGLMGELVSRYGLGLTCNPRRSIELAACLRKAIADPRNLANPTGMANFASLNDRAGFTETILRTTGLGSQ